ncbi:hypothetical protein QQ215_002801 [Vibrio vulnificus]|nr:hypothetical protein [Vibrio vulnificus]
MGLPTLEQPYATLACTVVRGDGGSEASSYSIYEDEVDIHLNPQIGNRSPVMH